MSQSPSLHSMTGYASIEGSALGKEFRLDGKTLNHRFLETKLKLPRELQFLDSHFRSLIKSKLSRGSLDIRFEYLPKTETEDLGFEISKEKLKKYADIFSQICKDDSSIPKPQFRDLLTIPDVVTKSLGTSQISESNASDEFLKEFRPIAEQFLNQLIESRRKEGVSIKAVFEEKLSTMESLVSEITEKRKQKTTEIDKKVTLKIKEAYEKYQAPSGLKDIEFRTSAELALILDRTDVDEEIKRLNHHIGHFKKEVQKSGAIGKKLEFIVQEMFREVNTIGSKAQDIGISEHVVQAKVTIEQIREQVLNVE